MQPLINPYYFQNQFQQPQTPQYIPQTIMQINGRLIDNIESVSANDVPMTGISVFPKADMSEVYIKSWQPNGTIQTLRFLPYKPIENVKADTLLSNDTEPPKWASMEVTDGIMNRLDSIEERLDKLAKSGKAKNEPKSDN